MKQIFIAIILMQFFFAKANAQNFGFKASVNLANQSKVISSVFYPNGLKSKTKPLAGYQLGFFYKINLATKWQLSIEPAYSTIGSKNQYTTESNIFDPVRYYYNDKVSYIDIPVTVQCSAKNFYFGVGPGLGIKVNSEISSFEDNSFKTSNYKSLDFTANAILGYKVCDKLDVNLRYAHGLINVFDGESINTKNRFFNFSILYFFKK